MPTTRPLITADQLDVLRDSHAYLDFLVDTHRETLRVLARDERIWEYTKTLLLDETYDRQFDNYFGEAMAITRDGGQCFAIHDAAQDSLIGMTRVYDVDYHVRKATIGFTWYTPAVWGKVHNKSCKWLLLHYLFDTLGMMRVDFKVAGQNIRSQKAVMKIGGVPEGVLRHYTMRNDGTPADTHFFSILGDEWPEKKRDLINLIASYASTSPFEHPTPK